MNRITIEHVSGATPHYYEKYMTYLMIIYEKKGASPESMKRDVQFNWPDYLYLAYHPKDQKRNQNHQEKEIMESAFNYHKTPAGAIGILKRGVPPRVMESPQGLAQFMAVKNILANLSKLTWFYRIEHKCVLHRRYYQLVEDPSTSMINLSSIVTEWKSYNLSWAVSKHDHVRFRIELNKYDEQYFLTAIVPPDNSPDQPDWMDYVEFYWCTSENIMTAEYVLNILRFMAIRPFSLCIVFDDEPAMDHEKPFRWMRRYPYDDIRRRIEYIKQQESTGSKFGATWWRKNVYRPIPDIDPILYDVYGPYSFPNDDLISRYPEYLAVNDQVVYIMTAHEMHGSLDIQFTESKLVCHITKNEVRGSRFKISVERSIIDFNELLEAYLDEKCVPLFLISDHVYDTSADIILRTSRSIQVIHGVVGFVRQTCEECYNFD